MEDVIEKLIFYIEKITNFNRELSKNILTILLLLVIVISWLAIIFSYQNKTNTKSQVNYNNDPYYNLVPVEELKNI